MNTKIPRRLIAALIVLSIALCFNQPAYAHPADMYAQKQIITLSPDGLEVEWSITTGPLLAHATWYQADLDESKTVSQSEAETWVSPLVASFAATIDDSTTLAWQLESIDWPTDFTAFEIGDQNIVIRLRADWPPDAPGEHRFILHNRFQEQISIDWFTLQGEGGIGFTLPEQTNGQIAFTVLIPAAPGDDPGGSWQTFWDSGRPSLPIAAAAPGVIPQNKRASEILTGLVRSDQLSLPFLLTALGVSLLLGAVHALTPGHGKALVAAYLVGSRGTPAHAAALGGIVTLTHTGTVVALGVVTLVASQFFLPTDLFPVLEIVSGLLIIGMGINLLWRRWRGMRGVLRSRKKAAGRGDTRLALSPELSPLQGGRMPPDGGTGGTSTTRIAIGESIPVRVYDDLLPGSSPAAAAAAAGGIRWQSLITLGVSGGLVPCPDAIAILLVAIAINRLLLGLSLVLAFSFGLALVLIAIGLMMVQGGRFLGKSDIFTRAAPILPVFSAVIVLILGVVLTVGALIRVLPDSGLTLSAQPNTPTFDLDRAQVVYMGLDDQRHNQLFAVPAADGDPTQLTFASFGIWDYVLSPDQQTIVYAVPGRDDGSTLWMVGSDGSDRRILLNCPSAACSGMTFSPDGLSLVYERLDIGGPNQTGYSTLWWVDAASGETGPIFQDDLLPGLGANWSSDGAWLSYISPGSNSVQMYNVQDGRSQSLPTKTGITPSWQPGSESILLTENRRVEANRSLNFLLRYDLETGELVDLSGDADLDDKLASWSPDGEWIALVRGEVDERGISRGDNVWLMRADGSDAHLLTDATDTIHGEPVWSSDGKYLLVRRFFLKQQSAQPGIVLLEVESGDIREVAEGYQPSWLVAGP